MIKQDNIDFPNANFDEKAELIKKIKERSKEKFLSVGTTVITLFAGLVYLLQYSLDAFEGLSLSQGSAEVIAAAFSSYIAIFSSLLSVIATFLAFYYSRKEYDLSIKELEKSLEIQRNLILKAKQESQALINEGDSSEK